MGQHYRPRLNKRFIETRDGYDCYSVNAFAVRNLAEPNEEFTNFATRDDFPNLIPDGEIWIASRLVPREGEFFMTNAVARLKALEAGASKDTAYTIGLNAERKVRARRTGLEYRAGRPHKHIPGKLYVAGYLALPDERGPVEVWVVDGMLVRCMYRTDFAEGGHGYVYDWCPKSEVWVETDLDRAEMPFIVAHEFVERRLMRDEGLDYERAHRVASEVEFDLRKPDRRKDLPGLSRRRIHKADLRKVAAREFYDYVRRHYPRGLARRVGGFLATVAEKVMP
jgi:hypothetical protein